MHLSPKHIALSAIILLFIAHSCYLGGYLTDDSFIAFRYARNLAVGNGPVFNKGERVEGYTSFGWMLILALLHYIGSEPIAASRILGLFFGAATIVLCFSFTSSQRANAPLIICCLPSLFLALNGGFALWARAGMETPLFTFLLAWATFTTVGSGKKTRVGAALLYSVAALVRPEGLLFLLLAIAFVYYRSRSIRETIIFSTPAILVLAPYQIWRITYYGEIFPNTFYAKTSSGLELIPAGFDYLARGFSSLRLWILLIPALASFLAPGSRKISCFFLWLAFPYCAYVIYVGGDWMPMFRFIIPVLPLFYVTAAIGMDNLLGGETRTRATRYVFIFWFALIACAGLLTFEYSFAKRAELITRYHNVMAMREVGLWLAENASPDATIALGFVGAIPYYSNLETVDIWGLTNADIAHLPFRLEESLGPSHSKHSADIVLARAPDIIIFNGCLTAAGVESPKPQDPAERELFSHPVFSSKYRHECVPLDEERCFHFYINGEQAGKALALP